MEFHSRGGGEGSPQGPIPAKKKIQLKKNPEEEFDWVEVPIPPTARRARTVYFFFFNLGLRLQTRGFCLVTFRTGEYVGEIEGPGIEKIGRRVGLGWYSSGFAEGKAGRCLGNGTTSRQGVGFLGNMLIRVEIEDGGMKAKVESCGLGNQVAWMT